MTVLGLSCDLAQSRSLRLMGTAGYLSEWEISGTASGDVSDGGDLSGPITLRHIGLCAATGPVERSGIIKFRISGWGPLSRIDATMSFENAECIYRGRFSDRTKGSMDCSDAKGIPVTLSIK